MEFTLTGIHYRCQAFLHIGRPDRGQETRCPFRATQRVAKGADQDLLVCGNHARAYVNTERLRMSAQEGPHDL